MTIRAPCPMSRRAFGLQSRAPALTGLAPHFVGPERGIERHRRGGKHGFDDCRRALDHGVAVSALQLKVAGWWRTDRRIFCRPGVRALRNPATSTLARRSRPWRSRRGLSEPGQAAPHQPVANRSRRTSAAPNAVPWVVSTPASAVPVSIMNGPSTSMRCPSRRSSSRTGAEIRSST